MATAAELVANEHLRARGYWTEVDGRTCPGPFVTSTAWSAPALGPPPEVGAHPPLARRTPPPVPPARSRSTTALPLAGLKVIDLTWVFAGPLATRVLADFGATVIKVEGPGHPDASRGGRRRSRGDLSLEGSVAFAHFNCGKLGLSLDLNNEHGPGRPARPRPLGRRARRVVHARRDGGVGPRLRVAARGSTRGW